MEKTRCKLNICGVEVTVAGDVEREAAEKIAEAVRGRMQRILSTAYGASIEKAAVITAMNLCEELARRDQELEAEFRTSGFLTCRNPAPERGIASSIRLGVELASPDNALLFLPADQPLLSVQTLRRIADAYAQTGLPVVPTCGGVWRGPCLLPPELRDALLALEGDQGGTRLLRGRRVATVETADEREFLDADTAEALAEIERKSGRSQGK